MASMNGQRFDIAHGAANFDDGYIDIGGHFAAGGFDFVGYVRNDLHGFAKIIAAAFTLNDVFVNAAGREIVRLAERRMGEALVVAKVEICFGAVICDEHFAMLERTHGAGIDVQVWIELLQGDAKAPAFQKAANGRGRDSLPQRRNNATGDEYVLRQGTTSKSSLFCLTRPQRIAGCEQLVDALQIFGSIDPQRLILRFHNTNAITVFEGAQLFETFGLL